MAESTAIEWTNATWNPWYGCAKVSQGCKNCYMYRDMQRYGRSPQVVQRSKTKFREPLSWKEPMKVFTCSWSDFFIKEADKWRGDAWQVIRDTPHLTYQILTKRIERVQECLPPDWGDGYPNVWLGTSVEDPDAKWRIDELRRCSAVVRFISFEPLLADVGDVDLAGIHWAIVGGESGPGARPMHPRWVRDLRDQATAAGVSFFFKQWGEWLPNAQEYGCHQGAANYNRPHVMVEDVAMCRVGKQSAGATLDGQRWTQYPVYGEVDA